MEASSFGPPPFWKKKFNPFAGVDPGLAAAAGGLGADTGIDPRTWQRGPQTSNPFAWFDKDFREALGEAWTNNDMAAGYQSAMNPAAPPGQSFGSRTVQPAQNTPQSPWVNPTASSGYGDVLGHPIEGFRKRPGSLF